MKPYILFYKLLLILLLNSVYSNAQLFNKFSHDFERFEDQFEEWVEPNITDENQQVLDRFWTYWATDSIMDDTIKNQFIDYFTLLKRRKARPNPHVFDYLRCEFAFMDSEHDVQSYLAWKKGLRFSLEEKKMTLNKLADFLSQTNFLLQDKILFKSSSVTWKSDQSFEFVFEENILRAEFLNGNLVCYAKRDSLIIKNTQGSLNMWSNIWSAQNALLTWERAGLDSDVVYADLENYVIELSRSEYTADSVYFYHKEYFDEPLLGRIEDKVKYIKDPENASYPKFFSYKSNFNITDIYQDVNYVGGLSMQGSKLIGKGSDANPSHLDIYRKDTLVFKALSNYFVFKKDRVLGINTAITIQLEQDSIYHPNLRFHYFVSNREISLVRTDDFSSKGPYMNTYHNVDMNFERLLWRIEEPVINFTMLPNTSMGEANFESVNFFNLRRFQELQLRDRVNPLIRVKSFAKKHGSDVFTLSDFADYMKLDLYKVKHFCVRLASKGFIFYNPDTEIIEVKQRTYDYLLALMGNIDYDVINIKSKTNNPVENASLDLNNFDLIVNGVSDIFLSDSQNVFLYPENERIIMKRNRSFQFEGRIEAGMFSFYGKNFFFDYPNFLVTLQNIDSLQMRYLSDSLDNYGKSIVVDVHNQIEGLTGKLLIDHPQNKSGVKNFAEFPIFRSTENSRVYFDHVESGVYPRESFFFELDTFELKSINRFRKENIVYAGMLKSSGILPPLREALRVQPDNSLGFIHRTGDEGMPVYQNKARMINDIRLSDKGLRAGGQLKYLTSTTYARDFHMYPDSLNAETDAFEIERKETATEYPWVSVEQNYIHYLPYEDKLYAEKLNNDFLVLNDTTNLDGNMLLQPNGLSASGQMDLKNSEMISQLFTYDAWDIHADTARFFLKSLNKEGYTVLTDNVNAHVNYTKKQGLFRSNEDFSLVEFPENRYVSYIDVFNWDMEETRLSMGNPDELGTIKKPLLEIEDKDLVGPYYISIHPDQDSLRFVSPLASYNYRSNLIEAKGVKYIRVADSKIYPKEEKVTVAERAKMRRLSKAKIQANQQSRHHLIYNAEVDVFSRHNYFAEGDYDYVDKNNEIQVIHFNEIAPDTNNQTVARGRILEPDEFTLSPFFNYQGEVKLFADNKYLFFDGATKITHNCKDLALHWFDFESFIVPDSIYIPVSAEPQDINYRDLYNGVMMAHDSIHLFSAFLSKRQNYSDTYIVTADGYLHFDENSDMYKITSLEKYRDFSSTDNYMSLDRMRCEQYGEGTIDLGVKTGLVGIDGYGNVRRYLDENKTRMKMAMGLDFYLHPSVIQVMAKDFDSIPGTDNASVSSPLYRKTFRKFLGEEVAATMFDELNLFGQLKNLPEEITQTFLFTELNMVWNDESNSYQSVGDIGIGSINGIQINKKFEGFMEIVHKRSGDLIDFYIKLDNRTWYYFGYSARTGVMQTLSSNMTYVNTIKQLKNKERKVKSRGMKNYVFMVSTERKKAVFLRRWQTILNQRNENGATAEPEKSEQNIQIVE